MRGRRIRRIIEASPIAKRRPSISRGGRARESRGSGIGPYFRSRCFRSPLSGSHGAAKPRSVAPGNEVLGSSRPTERHPFPSPIPTARRPSAGGWRAHVAGCSASGFDPPMLSAQHAKNTQRPGKPRPARSAPSSSKLIIPATLHLALPQPPRCAPLWWPDRRKCTRATRG